MIFFNLDGTLLGHDSVVKKALIKMVKVKSIDGDYSEAGMNAIWLD